MKVLDCILSCVFSTDEVKFKAAKFSKSVIESC